MRILKILFIILLVVFPFGELLRFDLGYNVRFKPLDVVAGFIALYFIFLLVAKKIKPVTIHWTYIVFPLVCLVSLAVNSVWLDHQDVFVASFYLVRWVIYLILVFAVMQFDDAFKKKLLLLLVIDGLLIVLLGFVQFFFFSSLKPLYYLGWDDHMYRLFSVFLDPNFTGGILVLYLLFILGLIHNDDNKNIVGKKNNYKIILGVIALLTLVALLLTFSRSSLLMMIVGVSVFFLLIGKKRLILLLLCIIVLFTVIISPKFNVENINLFRQASSAARIYNYQTALPIIIDHPLLGVGFNAYRYAKERYAIQMGWVNAPSHADAGVENSFLFVLVTTGITGLVIYCLLWWHVFLKAWAAYRKDKNMFSIIVIASITGLFVHAMFLNSLFFPAILVWMWIQIGLMESTSH